MLKDNNEVDDTKSQALFQTTVPYRRVLLVINIPEIPSRRR